MSAFDGDNCAFSAHRTTATGKRKNSILSSFHKSGFLTVKSPGSDGSLMLK